MLFAQLCRTTSQHVVWEYQLDRTAHKTMVTSLQHDSPLPFLYVTKYLRKTYEWKTEARRSYLGKPVKNANRFSSQVSCGQSIVCDMVLFGAFLTGMAPVHPNKYGFHKRNYFISSDFVTRSHRLRIPRGDPPVEMKYPTHS